MQSQRPRTNIPNRFLAPIVHKLTPHSTRHRRHRLKIVDTRLIIASTTIDLRLHEGVTRLPQPTHTAAALAHLRTRITRFRRVNVRTVLRCFLSNTRKRGRIITIIIIIITAPIDDHRAAPGLAPDRHLRYHPAPPRHRRRPQTIIAAIIITRPRPLRTTRAARTRHPVLTGTHHHITAG